MSEEINNRKFRQGVIKSLIEQLYEGKTVDDVKAQFAEAFDGVSAAEISQAEQALIAEGLPVSEVQRLCDVHAAVFKGSIAEIHQSTDVAEIPGHPVNTMKRENRAIDRLVREIRTELVGMADGEDAAPLLEKATRLLAIDSHYLKKENLYFPFMEQYGITAPPKVMWGVDDEIRDSLKAAVARLASGTAGSVREDLDAVLEKIVEMIFKEENIMLPMLLENLTVDEWKRIADDTEELGLCLIKNVPAWMPPPAPVSETAETNPVPPVPVDAAGRIILPTGVFTNEELARVLDTLPVDITFVDRDDNVKYFSQSKERIFPRTKSIIGRKVSNCHPPASVHIVEGIVNDFKAGRKDHEDFWIPMGERFVFIRYFAVRNEAGEYLGTLEVTQNIKPIQEITGEKRLVSEGNNG